MLRTNQPGEVFVSSELTFDELYNRSTSFKYLATRELLQRIRRPGAGLLTRKAQITHLHSRLTRPLLTLVGLFLVIPLIAQRERMNLVTNLAICMGVLGVVYGLSIGLLMVGNTGLIRPALAAWAPLIFGGGPLCLAGAHRANLELRFTCAPQSRVRGTALSWEWTTVSHSDWSP